jgi:hypothetical protein
MFLHSIGKIAVRPRRDGMIQGRAVSGDIGGRIGGATLHSILHRNKPMLDGQLRIAVQAVQINGQHNNLRTCVTRI